MPDATASTPPHPNNNPPRRSQPSPTAKTHHDRENRARAAFEQLARDRQPCPVRANALGRLGEVFAVRLHERAACSAASNSAHLSVGGPCRLRCPAARRWSDW